jgi:hypothetical protein
MSLLKQSLAMLGSSLGELVGVLLNTLQHFAELASTWMRENTSLLVKMASAAILIHSTWTGTSDLDWDLVPIDDSDYDLD